LLEEFFLWRLVINQCATLQELDTHWSIDDVMRANAVLDVKEEIETAMMPKVGKNGRS
jgi:hypothetical protein